MIEDRTIQAEYNRIKELRKQATSEHCKSVATGMILALGWIIGDNAEQNLPSNCVVEMLFVEMED